VGSIDGLGIMSWWTYHFHLFISQLQFENVLESIKALSGIFSLTKDVMI
jgi:hypothetical protein